MSALRHCRRGLAVSVLTTLLITPLVAGCDLLGGPEEPPEEVEQEEVGSFGPCLPSFASEVSAASMNRAGNRALYLTAERPPTLPEEASWGSDDRAIMVMDGVAGGQGGTPAAEGGTGGMTIRSIALTWDPTEEIPPFPTTAYAAEEAEPYPLPEQMVDLQLAAEGNRFIVAVVRDGVAGTLSKLYSGMVPESGSAQLQPGEGLALVPLNRYDATQGLQSYALSGDGSRVAAVVGTAPGEVRVYDLQEERVYVYTLGEGGQVEVQHELPPVVTSIEEPRQPAVASNGVIRLSWAPTHDRLAIAADLDVGDAGLYILDVKSGEVELVHRFSNSTAPWVAWSQDGESLLAMNSPLSGPVVFGNTELRRLQAVENGREIGSGVTLDRPLGWKTVPAYLTPLGDDQHYVFNWEGRLFRLDTPGTDLSQTSFQALTVDPPAMTVFGQPSVSGLADTALFLVTSGRTTAVGARTHVSAEACPEVPVATGEPGGEESPAATTAEAGTTEPTTVEAATQAPAEATAGRATSPATPEAEANGTEAGPSGTTEPAATATSP
jgi:cell division septation protein DedD